ncbi:hypothetical protein HOE22_03610 [Candidatus Woesearchaeota archaeon]|nr:hypothetical protein [Candidatus Woesearchaeota archaeon]
MVIGIDVDGVLRDFCEGLTSCVKENYPHYIKKDFSEINNWQLEENFNCSREDLRQLYWYDYAEEIIGNSNPIYGSIEQMYDLFDWAETEGHSLVCVTSQRKNVRQHTLTWLGKHGLPFDTIYFRRGRHKWQTPIDYLVDDSPKNWESWKKNRGHEDGYILVDQAYNQHIKSSYRITELKQVKDIVSANQG